MAAAARLGDPTGHPGVIAGGVSSVLIESVPAATVGSQHICNLPPTAGPHAPSAITRGSQTVTIGGRQAARVGDTAGCGAPITMGAITVFIGG